MYVSYLSYREVRSDLDIVLALRMKRQLILFNANFEGPVIIRTHLETQISRTTSYVHKNQYGRSISYHHIIFRMVEYLLISKSNESMLSLGMMYR